MGMTTSVIGYKQADEKWHKLKAVWDSCKELNLTIPREVLEYFNHEYPHDKPGMKVDIQDTDCCFKYSNSDYPEDGFEIHVAKIPKNVDIIRFVNSY